MKMLKTNKRGGIQLVIPAAIAAVTGAAMLVKHCRNRSRDEDLEDLKAWIDSYDEDDEGYFSPVCGRCIRKDECYHEQCK